MSAFIAGGGDLKGQRAVPRRFSELGHGIPYPGIDQALANVV